LKIPTVLHQKNLLEVGLLHLLVGGRKLLLPRWQQEDKKIRNDKQQAR
jgi:hypothetical protein